MQALTNAQQRAIEMLKEVPHRDIYEGMGNTPKEGSGLFYITYSNGKGPVLSDQEVRDLLRRGLIRELYPSCYCLAEAVRP